MKLQHLKEGYEAFVLTQTSRQHLLRSFPPKYPNFIGHHVTHRFGVPKDPEGLYGFDNQDFKVVGYAEDDGIEVLVVSNNNSLKRPDGKTYHITWSLDRSKGWKPVDSNRVIAEKGFQAIPNPIPFQTQFEYLT